MNSSSGSAQLDRLLAYQNEEGKFPISILTDIQGLTIASATMGMDPERQSAVVAFAQKIAIQAGKQLGMAEADELSFYDTAGQHLICRPFVIDGHRLILAAIAPDRNQSYRRVTNHTISEIRRIWKAYWK